MNKKRFSIVLLSASVLLGTGTVSFASDYENHNMRYGIKKALSRNIVSLDHKEMFYPDKATTRAEFASMLTNALGLSEVSSKQFKDVPSSHRYYEDIQKAYAAGLIAGYNEREFKPDSSITREEMVLMMYRYIKKNNVSFPTEEKTLFKDKAKHLYPEIIQASKNLGLVAGYGDNTFRGKSVISKAEAVAILMRTIEKVEAKLIEDNKNIQQETEESKEVAPPSSNIVTNPIYHVMTSSGVQKTFNNYKEAFTYFTTLNEQAYIMNNNTSVDFNLGVARTKDYTLVYQDGKKESYTYLAKNSELRYESLVGDKLYFDISGVKLYVYQKDVEILPINSETSYYINQNNKLYHKIFNNGDYSSYHMGNAPEFMMEEIAYRSFEGNIFDGNYSYQYFNYLPLRTPTSYTGSDLDKYIRTYSPDSPLNGYGQVFVDAAKKNNLNPMYLLANAIHESGWGKSQIAKEKNNLFGFKAYDANAYDSAASFQTLKEGIEYCAEYISNRYLTPGTWTYNSGILGNKGIGMNVKYASDPFWGQKIAGHMYRMDELLGNKELNKYLIGKLKAGATIYHLENGTVKPIEKLETDRIVAKIQIVQTPNGSMIELFSDDLKYNRILVSPTDFNEVKTN